MKKYRFLWLTLLAALMIGTVVHAREFGNRVNSASEAPMKPHTIQKLDLRLGKHQALRRDFRNQKEFLYQQRYQKHRKHRDLSPHPYHRSKQRGYRYAKRGWELAYRYDRAPFYDRHGYYYGYFNRYGYSFEGQFYHYDKGYTYQDRIRGKELFGPHYYMPANYRYYGFDPSPRR